MTNNNSKNGNNTTFTFRNKFENRLVTDENRQIFIATFKSFINLGPDTARTLLWRLTYNLNDVEHLEENLQTLGLTMKIVPLGTVITLRDELRYQYELLHPEFLAVEVPDECLKAFTALKNRTDTIVANIVYGNCFYASYFDALSMTKIFDLLKSNNEYRYFRGLRDIGFSYKIAKYLNPYHKQIHDLLKALYDYNHRNVQSFQNTPFAELDNRLEDAGIDLPFTFGEEAQEALEPVVEATDDTTVQVPVEVPVEAQAEHPAETNSDFKALTPDAILEYKDVFTTFVESSDMNSLIQIRELGFDLNKVIVKKDAIIKLLEATKSLSD